MKKQITNTTQNQTHTTKNKQSTIRHTKQTQNTTQTLYIHTHLITQETTQQPIKHNTNKTTTPPNTHTHNNNNNNTTLLNHPILYKNKKNKSHVNSVNNK